MFIQNMFTEWAQVVNTPAENMKIHERYQSILDDSDLDDVLPVDKMAALKIRECDRKDYRDWMPYRMRVLGRRTRVYYINVNIHSPIHSHSLVLVINGIVGMIDEWDGHHLVSSMPANVEVDPKVPRPTDEDAIQFMSYIVTHGGTSHELPTIDGKPVPRR
jgi:hypothetical protein